MKRAAKRLVLFGYLGAGNIGDDLMLLGLLQELGSNGPPITVLAKEPDRLARLAGPRVTVETASLRNTLRHLRPGVHFIRVGGTSFHDEYGSRSMWRSYLVLALLYSVPRFFGGSSSALGVGAGAMTRRSTRFFARLAMSSADVVVVRDPASGRLLEEVAPRARLVDGVDLANLLTRPNVTEQREAFGISVLDLEPYLAVPPEKGEEARFWERTALSFLAAAGTPPTELRLLVFKDNDRESDRPAAEALAAALGHTGVSARIVSVSEGLEAFVSEVAGCRAVLATRYHAAILSVLFGCDTAIVPYNVKLRHLAEDFDIPPSAEIEPMCAAAEGFSLAQPQPSEGFRDRLGRLKDEIALINGGGAK